MNALREPVISVGQVYLHEELNEYFVITKNDRLLVSYAGKNFSGRCDALSLIEKFPPVDVNDLTDEEMTELLGYLNDPRQALRTGYINEEN